MKMRATLTWEYEVPDDEERRLVVYSTADPREMAVVDMENDPVELWQACDPDDCKLTIEPCGEVAL